MATSFKTADVRRSLDETIDWGKRWLTGADSSEAAMEKCVEFTKIMVLVLGLCVRRLILIRQVLNVPSLKNNQERLSLLGHMCLIDLTVNVDDLAKIRQARKDIRQKMKVAENNHRILDSLQATLPVPIPRQLMNPTASLPKTEIYAYHGFDNIDIRFKDVPISCIETWDGIGWPAELAQWFTNKFTMKVTETHPFIETGYILNCFQKAFACNVPESPPSEAIIEVQDPETVFRKGLAENPQKFMKDLYDKVRRWERFHQALADLMLKTTEVNEGFITDTDDIDKLESYIDRNERTLYVTWRQAEVAEKTWRCMEAVTRMQLQIKLEHEVELDDLDPAIFKVYMGSMEAPYNMDELGETAFMSLSNWNGEGYPEGVVEFVESVTLDPDDEALESCLKIWQEEVTGKKSIDLEWSEQRKVIRQILEGVRECKTRLDTLLKQCITHSIYMSKLKKSVREMIDVWVSTFKSNDTVANRNIVAETTGWSYLRLLRRILEEDNYTKRKIVTLKDRINCILQMTKLVYCNFHTVVRVQQEALNSIDARFSSSLQSIDPPIAPQYQPDSVIFGTRTDAYNYLQSLPARMSKTTKKAIAAVQVPARDDLQDIRDQAVEKATDTIRPLVTALDIIKGGIDNLKVRDVGDAGDEIPLEALKHQDVAENMLIVANFFEHTIRPMLVAESSEENATIGGLERTGIGETMAIDKLMFNGLSLGGNTHNMGEYLHKIDEGVVRMNRLGNELIERSVTYMLFISLKGRFAQWREDFQGKFKDRDSDARQAAMSAFFNEMGTIEQYKNWIRRTGETEFYKALERCKKQEEEKAARDKRPERRLRT